MTNLDNATTEAILETAVTQDIVTHPYNIDETNATPAEVELHDGVVTQLERDPAWAPKLQDTINTALDKRDEVMASAPDVPDEDDDDFGDA